MLCGEFHRAPLGLHLSFSDTRSPYSSLLALLQGMAAITAHAVHDDEDIFLGVKSDRRWMLRRQLQHSEVVNEVITGTIKGGKVKVRQLIKGRFSFVNRMSLPQKVLNAKSSAIMKDSFSSHINLPVPCISQQEILVTKRTNTNAESANDIGHILMGAQETDVLSDVDIRYLHNVTGFDNAEGNDPYLK
ncbi:hypothetical protein Trydic_g20116 [Trypoxylus dichotomus]